VLPRIRDSAAQPNPGCAPFLGGDYKVAVGNGPWSDRLDLIRITIEDMENNN
jgi:hypothetical protein